MTTKKNSSDETWVNIGDIAPNEKVDVDLRFKDAKIVILKGSILEATAMEDIQKGDFVTVKYVRNKFQARKWKPHKK
jgi:hypothetical protein